MACIVRAETLTRVFRQCQVSNGKKPLAPSRAEGMEEGVQLEPEAWSPEAEQEPEGPVQWKLATSRDPALWGMLPRAEE